MATRPFSFYPPIVNVEHNEWLFRKASWSEILVVNCKSSVEVWIPRRFIGEVSRVDDPVLIVGLNREVEYKGGMIVPFQRRVIEMPVAVGGPVSTPAPPDRSAPAPIVGIRTESPTDTRLVKLIGGTVAFAILFYLVVVNLSRGRVVLTPKDQTVLGLTAREDRTAVIAKLGEPESDRWQSDNGAVQYEALGYPDRHLTVILMGSDRQNTLYVGAMDDRWRPIASVSLHSGGTTDSLLRNLKRF